MNPLAFMSFTPREEVLTPCRPTCQPLLTEDDGRRSLGDYLSLLVSSDIPPLFDFQFWSFECSHHTLSAYAIMEARSQGTNSLLGLFGRGNGHF